MPILGVRHEGVPLADCPNAKAEKFRVGVRCRPVDRGTSFRAKRLDAFVAARGRLYIDLGNAGEKPETALNRRNNNPEGRAGQSLAIGAVADLDRFRIDFRFKG